MPDIIIRGMEMPTEEEISKFIIIRYDGEVWIGESDNLVDGGFVACYPTNPMRAVPLPEEHGRLGDLDKLESFLRTLALYQSGERQQGILGCCETIKATPTIVPADVTDNYVGSKSEEGETDGSKL